MGEVYNCIAVDIDYKDRDALVSLVCETMGNCQVQIAEWMNVYFFQLGETAHKRIDLVLDLYKAINKLAGKVLFRSFNLLTENVGSSQAATHCDHQAAQRGTCALH